MKEERILKGIGSKLSTGASIRGMDDPYQYRWRKHDFHSLRQDWRLNSPRSESGALLYVTFQSAICSDGVTPRVGSTGVMIVSSAEKFEPKLQLYVNMRSTYSTWTGAMSNYLSVGKEAPTLPRETTRM
jgi:hypothetical protein